MILSDVIHIGENIRDRQVLPAPEYFWIQTPGKKHN